VEEFKKVWKPDLAHDGAGCISEHAAELQGGQAGSREKKRRGKGMGFCNKNETSDRAPLQKRTRPQKSSQQTRLKLWAENQICQGLFKTGTWCRIIPVQVVPSSG